MKLTHAPAAGANYISAVEEGLVRLGQRRFEHSIIVFPDAVVQWSATDAALLALADLEPALAGAPEIVLLGTGRTQVFPDPGLISLLARGGTALEAMDTPAACRTYNILVAEDRQVVAALIV